MRHGGVYARNAVQAFDKEVPALFVLVVALFGVLFRSLDGGVCHQLAQQRGAQTGLAVLHDGVVHQAVAGNQHAHADTALRVALAHGIDQDYMFRDTQRHGAHIGLVGVNEFSIYLICNEIEVVFNHQLF